jgi:carboxymethylenebutenolidase
VTPGIQELMRQLERVWDGFLRAVLVAGDVDAAMNATAERTSLVNVPMLTGARDRDGLRRYLAEDLVPHRPPDLRHRRISRTVDRFRVVDELAVGFTHDRELPWLLPGCAPTHRRAEVLTVTVATIRQGRITEQRTLWDLAGLTTQLGLPPGAVRVGDVAPPTPTDGTSSWW